MSQDTIRDKSLGDLNFRHFHEFVIHVINGYSRSKHNDSNYIIKFEA